VRYRRCRRELAARGDPGFHLVRGQHLQRTFECRLRQRVRIDADIQGAVDALVLAVFADRLANREHVPFVEAALERAAAVSGRAEHDALCGHAGIGPQIDIRGEQLRYIDQQRFRRRFAGKRTDRWAHVMRVRIGTVHFN